MLYKDRIVEAISHLKDHTGSSMQDLKNLIQASLPSTDQWENTVFLTALKSGVATGDFVQVNGSYRLSTAYTIKLINAVKNRKKATSPTVSEKVKLTTASPVMSQEIQTTILLKQQRQQAKERLESQYDERIAAKSKTAVANQVTLIKVDHESVQCNQVPDPIQSDSGVTLTTIAAVANQVTLIKVDHESVQCNQVPDPIESDSRVTLTTIEHVHHNEHLRQNQKQQHSEPSRQSKRECKSTTMQIGGNTVLRANNYSVTACKYIFDVHQEDIPHKPKSQPKTESQPKRKVYINMPANQAQLDRLRHNKILQNSVRSKQWLRQNFFIKRLEILEPFVESKVLLHLKAQTSQPSVKIEPVLVAQPKMIRAKLRDYQLLGLNFMVNMHRQNIAMILGDEMGLGKTLQTISLICYLKEQEHVTGPSLVVCPLSVLTSWTNEIRKWSPSLKYLQLHSSNPLEQARQKREVADHATEYDIILTTYDMIKVPALKSLYCRLHFNYLVLDEGHKIKGHETQIAQAARKIHAGNKLLLTGTPLQNNLVELWALLNFLHPDILTTLEPFHKHYDLNNNVVDKSFLMKTSKLLEQFMLRRLKFEVEKLIPEKLETKVYCPMSKTQIFWYKSLLQKDIGQLSDMEDSPNTTSKYYLLRCLFVQLRKCCNHPFLFKGSEIDEEKTSLQELVAASGKLSVLDMLLQSLYKKDNRAVLFSQFTTMLDIIEDYCIMRGWKYCRLDGSTERAKRNHLINRFNEPDSSYFLFLVSTKSGGTGLNLQSADTCILFDSDWNPQSDIQAMGRVHRIGQTKTVHIYRLVSSGTVEERMLERAEKKLLLEMVNRESKSTTVDTIDVAPKLSAIEMFEDIKFGCEAIFGGAGNKDLPSWEEIDNITDRNRKESDSIGNLKGNTSMNAMSFDGNKEFSPTQFFGGVDFREIRKKAILKQKKDIPKTLHNIAYLWKEIQSLGEKRKRKSRLVHIDVKGLGRGIQSVAVLSSNNYELQNGESSVFERELSSKKKSIYQTEKTKRTIEFDNQDHCQVCGDGGYLVCCPYCPCSVHLGCVGMNLPKEFLRCPHHRCIQCEKSRAAAGGILFACQSCPNSFCEDCLPKEGITFLEKVDRFEKLGFDSTKNVVYIHCSPICENFAIGLKWYVPRKYQSHCYREPLEISYNFGASYDCDQMHKA